MEHLTTSVQTVRSHGVALRLPMARLPSRDLVQLRPAVMRVVNGKTTEVHLPMGTIWRRNWEHERETKGESTHAHYDDLYDLLRSGRHVTLGYGLGTPERTTLPSEASSIREDIVMARAYVRFVLTMGVYEPAERTTFMRVQSELVSSYWAKRNVSKVTARERFARGLILKDSLGRRNPSAAAWVTGAGISHLLARMSTMKILSTAIDRKTVYVYEYIREHIELYTELWGCLRGSSRLTPAAMERLLLEFRSAFSAITARPFCRNASHTRRDLDEALRLVCAKDRAGLVHQITRIRMGIRWMFALDYLQTQVITPYVFMLERLRGMEAKRLRAEGKKTRRIVIAREMAPDSFKEVESRLEVFITKLGKCSDVDLKTKVKDAVEAIAKDALLALQAGDWRIAKKRLLACAKKL